MGASSGLWPLAIGGNYPRDQHDDDMRGVAFTGDPFTDDIAVAGRPVATVRLGPGTRLGRLVLRLAAVDGRGRSTLIATGTVSCSEPTISQRVVFDPTAYWIGAGHHLRVVVSDADFPRLWPAMDSECDGRLLRVAAVEVSLPCLQQTEGTAVGMAVPDAVEPEREPLALRTTQRCAVTRDLINEGVEATFGDELAAWVPGRQHFLEVDRGISTTVKRNAPASARMHGMAAAVARMNSGEIIFVRVDLHATQTALTATDRISVDGDPYFSGRWEA